MTVINVSKKSIRESQIFVSSGSGAAIEDSMNMSSHTIPCMDENDMFEVYYSGAFTANENITIALTFIGSVNPAVQNFSIGQTTIGTNNTNTNFETIFTYRLFFRVFDVEYTYGLDSGEYNPPDPNIGVLSIDYSTISVACCEGTTPDYAIESHYASTTTKCIYFVNGTITTAFTIARSTGEKAPYTITRISSFIRKISR